MISTVKNRALFGQNAGAGIPDRWSVWNEILGRNWSWDSEPLIPQIQNFGQNAGAGILNC